MDKRIEELFRDYGKGFSALDLHKIAKLYGDTFISAGPKGVIAQNRRPGRDHVREPFRIVGEQRA